MNRQEGLARLKGAEWLETARPFFDCLAGGDGRTRAVGGIVRDTLLGLPRTGADIDLATELTPQEVMARGKESGLGVYPTGVEHGTVTLVSKGVAAEVTTLREDVETFGRRARVRFGTDWTRDAARRDFTMNALYADADGGLFDPLEGIADCLSRRVRFIGDASARIAEDRLRVFRYFRFVASHGAQKFDDSALAACRAAAAGLDAISAERVGHEMMRLLGVPEIARTVGEMAAAGVLTAETVSGDGLAAFERLEHLPVRATAEMRLAILALMGIDSGGLQRRWRLSNAVRKRAEAIVAGAGLAAAGDWYALAYYHGDYLGDAVGVAAAVHRRGEDWVREAHETLAGIRPGRFPLRGTDLAAAGFTPGPELGRELNRLERLWIESGYRLDKQALLDEARLQQRD